MGRCPEHLQTTYSCLAQSVIFGFQPTFSLALCIYVPSTIPSKDRGMFTTEIVEQFIQLRTPLIMLILTEMFCEFHPVKIC